MTISDLTVVILTKNEESNIEAVVKNARQVTDKVLVIDSGSTDNTVDLAEANGAKVVYRAWDNDFSAQRNFALEYVETEWVLYLDADERLNSELVKAVKDVLAKNENKKYAIRRKSVAFGKKFNYGVLYPDHVCRMFKKDRVKWVNKVHEHPECVDQEVILDGYAEHYTYVSWEQWLKKFDQYTTIWAENAYEHGRKASVGGALGHALSGFIHMYVIKRGALDGWMGFALSANHFFYTFMKYLKLIELNRTRKR